MARGGRDGPRACHAGLAFSAGIGISFSLYPARQASRLNPIEAPHWE